MDLFKKKFDKKKKKSTTAQKKNQSKAASKNSSKNKAKKKKQASKKKRRNSKHSSSSSDSSDSSDSQKNRLRAVQSKLAIDAANIDKKYRMAGALLKKPENPPDFNRKVLEAEWREMCVDPKVTVETVKTLDEYLKNRAELKSTDHVVIAERVDEENDKKSTTRLKILTKFDEGRFAAIYMVQNESAVNNDVVSVGNGRLMMKTALRQLSSHQITYRLSREITALKSLWSKRDDVPPRVPPIIMEGRMLGVPFYVTNIYDVNLEKCREEMGGGLFCVPSAMHVGNEILSAIKFMHRRQLVHRDVKPTNILLSYQNREQWHLIDFGDTISAGRSSVLSPPDGQTLPFLSREAHEVLQNTAPSSFQQDLESWFLVLVDMCKPLPWKNNPRIDLVVKEKQEFFKNLSSRISDLPPVFLEVSKLLKSDPPPYVNISKKLIEARDSIRNSKEGWTPEWLDRAGTKKKARAITPRGRNNTGSMMGTVDGDEVAMAPQARDRSVYISAVAETPRGNTKPSKEAHPTGSSPSKMLAVDDRPKDRSVYCNEFPEATNVQANDGKKKYRYRPKNK